MAIHEMENSVIIKNHIFKECVLAVTILLSHSPQTLVFQSFRESPPLILLQPLWILLGHHFPFPDRSQCLFSVPNILAVHSFYCFLTYMCVCMLIHFSRVQLCATLWTAAHQAPLSMGFTRQEYRSGLPCPPPYIYMGFPGGASDKESTYQCRRHKRPGFHPWDGKIPWRRRWQPTPVFLPEIVCVCIYIYFFSFLLCKVFIAVW